LQKWDRNTDVNSVPTSLFGSLILTIWKDRHYGDGEFVTGIKGLTEAQAVVYLQNAVDNMVKKFGTYEVRWGDIHKLRRGSKSLPIGSFADLLSPSYPEEEIHDGKVEYVPKHGDTFTMFVKYGKNGAEQVESLEPLGNSLNPQSPHYTDQMELFVNQKLKFMPFEKIIGFHIAKKTIIPNRF
jgi:acyl-homoserine-lactone acylase